MNVSCAMFTKQWHVVDCDNKCNEDGHHYLVANCARSAFDGLYTVPTPPIRTGFDSDDFDFFLDVSCQRGKNLWLYLRIILDNCQLP